MTFLFPFPSNHPHSHFRQQLYIDYLKAEKYVYCVVNSKQSMKLQQKHCYKTHHSSVIIIITITAYHCSLIRLSLHMLLWKFYFSPIKMLLSFQLQLFPFPFPLVAQNYSHFHGNPMGNPMGIPWEWEFPFPCTHLV